VAARAPDSPGGIPGHRHHSQNTGNQQPDIRKAHEPRKPRIDIYKLPLDDPDTYELLQRGDAKGVFQLESDGIRELLGSLHAKGWRLGVATGKSDRGLTGCLVKHGIFDLFVTLQTADRHPSKPDPSMLVTAMQDAGSEPRDTVMIGDTAFDMAMARAAGCRAIGVAWGYHAPAELLEAGAEAVAQTTAELEDLIDG